MCGIVGVFGNLFEGDKKAFRDMLLMDVVRGQDSTGVLNIPCSQAVYPKIYKEVGHPINLWDDYVATKANQDAFDRRGIFRGQSKGLLGHNRAATVGSVTVKNAHPFNFDHIYGVHNGSLWSTFGLEGDKVHDVDSMCIFDHIAAKGIDDAWKEIWGAVALVWWDEKERLLNFIRNDERPLWKATARGGTVLYIASEPWMIIAATSRHKVPFDKDSLEEIPVNTLHSYSVNVTKVTQEEVRELKNGRSRVAGFGVSTYQSTTHTANRPASNLKTGGTSSSNTQTPPRPTKLNSIINSGWTEGLKKLDKEDKDTVVALRFAIEAIDNNKKEWKHSILAHDEYNQKYYLYPSRLGTYRDWDAKIKEANKNDKTIHVRLNTRPRYEGEPGSDNFVVKVSADRLELVKEVKHKTTPRQIPEVTKGYEDVELFPIYNGIKVKEEGFMKSLKDAGGCCCNCGTVFELKDAESITWLDRHTITCDECKDDPQMAFATGGI